MVPTNMGELFGGRFSRDDSQEEAPKRERVGDSWLEKYEDFGYTGLAEHSPH
jgi:hypothetical protein